MLDRPLTLGGREKITGARLRFGMSGGLAVASLRRRPRKMLAVVAPSLILLAACQSAGDATIQAAPSPNALVPAVVPHPPILDVTQGIIPGEVAIQFGAGATPSVVEAIGHDYGLELSGGPLITGPLPSGRFVFQTAQAVIEAQTPTTAIVFFPSFTKHPDRMTFLADNKLRFMRWLRSDDRTYALALVELPPANLHPVLIDSVLGRFQISLPTGLTQESVVAWAVQNALSVISYVPETGITIVHPLSWQPPITPPVRISQAYPLTTSLQTPPPAPAPPVLYVQFAPSMTSDAINSVAQGLSLGVVSVTAGNLATLSVDPSRVKAEMQLLSDMASVQCVSPSPAPCGQITGASSATSSSPVLQPVGQPTALTLQIKGGVLELDWSAAEGATAYAIFESPSASGPFALAAVVAGRQHTSFQAIDVTAPGGAVYYQVIALHPCTSPDASPTCDASTVIYGGGAGVSGSWINPTQSPPAIVVTAPAPSPAATDPVTATPSAGPSPAPTPAATDPVPATPSASPPAVAPAPAPTAPAPAPPMQTTAGATPLAAPTVVNAGAADGHVVLNWAPVPGAAAYRLYRSTAGGPALYLAQTSQQSFIDVGGTAGVTYSYAVAGVAAGGLVGNVSPSGQATWAAATTTPSIVRALPVEANVLAGKVRFEIDVQSGTGQGSVQWRVTGPAAAISIGLATGQPNASAPLSWTAALTWDSANVPDGTYSVSATVVDAGGPQVTITSSYRIQNGAPPAPTSLNALAQSSGVALTWQQMEVETAATYRLFRDQPISGTPLAELSADRRTYVDPHATPGQHVYQLVLVDAAGHESPAAIATVTVAAGDPAPAGVGPDLKLLLPNGQPLTAGGRVTDRVLVVASPQDSLRFQLSSDGVAWADVGQLPTCGEVCSLDFDIRPLAAGPYLIRAATSSDAGGGHSFVRAEAVRYAAPGGLSAAAAPVGVQLTWNSPSTALPAFYDVERRGEGGDWQLLDHVASTSYIDSRAPTGTELQYRVTAVDSEGTRGHASNEASVSLPSAQWAFQEMMSLPIAPIGLHVTSSHGRAILSWQGVDGSTGYEVERESGAGGPFVIVGTTGGDTFSESPALSAGQYTYRVEALNGPVAGPASQEASTLVIPSAPAQPMARSSNDSPNPPPAPVAVKTSTANDGIQLSWSGAGGSPASTTYNLYRMNPQTGVFTEAASGLETTSFLDAGPTPGASYGYVVTASASSGLESAFSSPAWVTAALLPQPLTVNLVAPVVPEVPLVKPENLLALAQVTAAAGLAGVSFAVSGAGGLLRSFPGIPVDPRSPNVPSPAMGSGATGLWGMNFNTNSLAPGTYQLRVQALDLAGRSQEQVENLFIGGADARGPPSVNLTTTSISGGVHLEWASPAGTFTVQRSLFGSDGPFESIATTQSTKYDDLSAIPGLAYSYRVFGQSASAAASTVNTPSSVTPAPSSPVLQLGSVSQSELSVSAIPATQNHPLDAGLTALGQAFDINATSLATGNQVHHLGEPTQITFQLPLSASTVDAAAMGVYHWDDASASWVKESATTNPDATTISVTVDHLSLFVLASTNAQQSPANPGPPPSALNQPDGAAGAGGPQHQQSWSDLPMNADGEIPSLRTLSSAVYKTSSGGYQRVISAGLTNFKDSNGAWQKIDPTLVPNGNGGDQRNAAGPLTFDLPAIFGPISVDAAGGSLIMSIRGASPSRLQASGKSGSYSSILPGIDATYDVVSTGMNENLTIERRPTGPVSITYDLTTSGLVLSLAPDGSVTAMDAHGTVAFTMPAPWMMETPGGRQMPGAPSTGVAVTLTGGAGHYQLNYTPDLAWLQDPARRYPVTLDPSYTVYNENDSLGDQYGNVWCCGGWSPNYDYPVGLDGNLHKYRVLIQLDGSYGYQDIVCANCYATSAYLYMDEATDDGYSHPTIYAYETTQRYGLGSNTFNIGTQGSPATASAPTGSGWFSFNVTSIVRSWETTAQGAAGDFLVTGNECCYDDIFIYDASSGLAPYLTINYAGDSMSSPAPDPITAQPGSIVNIPLKLTNPNGDFTWGSSNLNDIVRVGVLSSTSTNGVSSQVSQPLSFLPSDVGPGGTINMNALVQAPLDPGDYWYTLDLRRDLANYPSAAKPAPIWFSNICGGTCNQTITVHVRVVAPGDQQAASVPVTVGDGSSVSVNSSNGSSTLSATDISISELGDTALSLSRTYNSVNGNLPNNSTNNSNSTYGVGWTFGFQRNLQLGTWSTTGGQFETLRNGGGLYTDSNGKTWPMVWNPGRGLWEDAAGGRTVTGPIPADLLQRQGTALQADPAAPFGHELYLGGGTPSALIFQAGRVPTLPGGSIEVWFKPDVDMSGDAAEYTLAADSLGYFIINWNGSGHSHQWCFSVYNKDINAWSSACSGTVNWTHGTWHQIVATWTVPGTMVKTLYLDGSQVSQYEDAGLSPMGDLYIGYHPQGAYAVLKGAIAGLRIDSSVLSQQQVQADFTANSETAYATTLFLGTFVNSPNSAATVSVYTAGAAGFDVMTNSDQSQEIYDPGTGRLAAQRDRLGNQIDYAWDSLGRISSIADHALTGRALNFCYPTNNLTNCTLPPANVSFRVTDPGSRTVDYTVNSAGDLVNVTKSNAVPDPMTGVVSQHPITTTYGYAGGHLLQVVMDPRGSRTNLNYDQSYRQVVMADVPSNYWRLGDVSVQTPALGGGVADSANPCAAPAPASCNGTYTGGVTLGQRGAAFGDSNTSAAFDGASASAALTGTVVGAGAPYTLEAWVKLTLTSGTRTVLAFTQGSSLGLLWLNAGVPTFRIATATSYVDVAAPTSLNGAWHQVVATYDGASARLYVDGQLTGGPTAVASGAGGTGFWIGSQNGAANTFFGGNIDEVALYPSALGGSRVQAHFLTGRFGPGASPTGYAATVTSDSPLGFWRLGEFVGNQAVDQSGFANSATYFGGYGLNQSPPLTADSTTSASFNGSTAYVLAPTYSITNAVTVEAWVYASTYAPGGFIVGKNPVNQNWELFVYNNLIYWRTGGTNCSGTGATDLTVTAPTTNTWHHIVAVQNGSTGQIYIDGGLAGTSSTMAAIGNSTYPVEIGRYGTYAGCTAAWYFVGSIANVAIYSAPLSATRIQAHYSAGRPAPQNSNPYPSAVLSDSPYGYWRLGEGSGSAVDSTGNGNTGTYMGTTLGQPGGIATDANRSTKFDGSTAYVSTPTHSITGSITVEAWVYSSSFTQNGFIVGKNPVNANWELFFQNNGYIIWRTGGTVNCGGSGYTDLTTPVPAGNAWHQIAAVENGSIGQIFVDGVLAASSTTMSPIGNSTGTIEIGRYGSTCPGYYFSGLIQDVSIYTAALTSNRILAHYQASRIALAPLPAPGGYAANVALDNPLAYWRLDEPAGTTTVLDRSGNGDPGTISGGVTLGVPGGLGNDNDTAAAFDGTSGYINVPDNSSLFNTGLSVEAWVKATTWVAAGSIVNRRTSGNVGGYIIEPANTAGQINFYVYAGGSWRAATTPALAAGVWHHLVGTYDGATVRIYADGVLAASTAYAGSVNAPAGPLVWIGKNAVSNLLFNGSIDEVAIYGTTLSAARVAAHYAAASSARRVMNVQDPRGTTASTFIYGDDAAMTQVIDGLGQSSYYSFQHAGGRTVSYQDPLGNLTSYGWNGRSAFQLDGTLSPAGILDSSISNSLAPVGQQSQSLITDKSNQPADQIISYAAASASPANWWPAGSATYGTWTWDYRQQVLPGVPTHSSPFNGTTQQQQFQNVAAPILVPAGATVTQWVYFQAGVAAPTEIMLQFLSQDANSWEHRAYWGANQIGWGTDGTASRRNQSQVLPLTGHWVPLTVQLAPVLTSAGKSTDVGMEGHTLGGIAYDVYSNAGSGTIWWGPTILDFPPASAPANLQHQTSTFAYNQTNDQIASVDANGIATVTDYDASGLARQTSSGAHAPTPPVVFEDPLMYNGILTNPWSFEQLTTNATVPVTANGTTTINGYGSLTQTHNDNASASDLYRDVSGLRPGTYARVSVLVSVQLSPTQPTYGTNSAGGAELWVDDGLLPNTAGLDAPAQRQSSTVQPAPNGSVQLSVLFLVDQTGRLRIHLVQMNVKGTTTWADVRIEDITPVPDVTLQGSRVIYMADFEQSTDRSAWTSPLPSGAEWLNDAARSHSGGYVLHISSSNNTSTIAVGRPVTVTPGSNYHISVWVKTVASGSYSETSGAGAQIQLTAANGTALSFPLSPAKLRTYGKWQLLAFDTPQLWYGAMTLTLSLGTFEGDVYFDDVKIEQSGTAPAPISLVQSASATGTTPVTVTLPAGTKAGDLLVATVQEQGVAGGQPSAPAGWTKIEDSEFAGGTSIWYSKNVAGGLTSFQFSTATSSKVFVAVSEWSGADPGAPLDVHAHGSQSGPSLQATASAAGATAGELAITAFTEQNTTGNYFTPGGAWTALASNNNFGSGNITSGVTDRQIAAANGTVSETETSSAAPTGSNWDWIIATFKPQPATPASTYWFSFTDTSYFSAVDLHVFNPGSEPALGAIVIPGQTPLNVNVAAGVNTYYSLKNNYASRQLGPIKVVTSVPVIASIRTQTTGGGFTEDQAQQAAAAAPTLYMSWYDSTGSVTYDYINVFNPGTVPVTGSIAGLGITPNPTFSLAPAGIQLLKFASTSSGPLTITASGPIMASQRVIYGNAYSEVPALSAAAAAPTVYLSNLAAWPTANLYVMNPAYPSSGPWGFTATVANGSTQTFSNITSVEQTFNYNGLAGGPVKVAASLPVLVTGRLFYTSGASGFLEVSGTANPAATQYFNWFDLASGWVATDRFAVANPGSTTATGTITLGVQTPLNINVAAGQVAYYNFAAGALGGPVTVSASTPVVVSQQVQTTSHYWSEVYAQPLPGSGVSGAPTAVVGVPGNGQATVEWSAPTSSGTSGITSYVVMSSSGTSTTTVGTSAVITGLANNSAYTFAVAAVNASGQGPWSSPSSLVTPGTTAVALPGSPGWQLVTSGGASATATQQLTGGIGNGPARVVALTATSTLGDVKDILPIATLRSGSTYVVSAWVSASAPGTVDFSLRDGSGNALAMDQSTTCSVTTTPTLCEGSLTYTSPDYQPAQLTFQYGGQGARTITISHPLVALSAERHDFSSSGQPTRNYDVFGHLTQTDYDSQGLYPIDTIERMSVDYHQSVLADAPLAYWPLDDGTGSGAVDLAGTHPLNVMTGSLVGSAVVPAIPSVHSLTNSSTWTSVASSNSVLGALNDTNGESIEMWVSLNGLPAYNDSVFALTGTGTGHLDRWNGDGTPYPAYFETARHHFNVQIPLTGVHYIVYTRRTGGRYRLYLDGVLVGDDPAGTFGVPSTLYLGGNGSNLSFKGNMADVAIYNSELSPTQVLTHYQVGAGQLDSQPTSYGTSERASYSASVAADAPLAYWRLGDAGGSAALDASGHGNGGTYSGGVTIGPGALAGDPNTSAVFDGSSGGMVSAPSVGLTTGATLEAWIKGNGAWSAGSEGVVAGSYYDNLSIVNGHPYASFQIGGVLKTLDSGVAISAGAWHHIATTWDGFTIRIYIDGSLAAFTATGPGALMESGNSSVGSINYGSNFNGAIDEAGIFGRALTSGRIQAHYWAGVSQVTASIPTYSSAVLADHPAGYWQLTDASGTTAADASGNNNTGTLAGGVTLNQPGSTADGTNSMAFDGSSGVITINNAATLNPTSALTLEAWVYLPALPTVFTNLFDKASYGEYRLGVDTTAAPKVSLQVTNGSLNNYIDNCPGVAIPASMTLNQWHHVAYTFDGVAGLVTMYVDGLPICQSSQTNNGNPLTAYNRVVVTTYQVVLGRDTSGTGYLNGRLGEAAVYGTALPARRILSHVQAGQVQFPNQTPYSANVLADRPAGYWRLGEGTGALISDSSGNSNVGVISGGVTLGLGSATPDGNTPASFDGATGMVTIPNAASLNVAKALTLEAWVYLPALPTQFTNLIDKASYGEYRLGVDTTAAPKVSLQVTNGSLYNYIDNCPGVAIPASMTLNQWHHLAYTFDGVAGLVTMYVDGLPTCQSSQTNNGNPLTAYNTVYVSSYPVVLGRDMGGPGYLNGRLDEVAVYASALPAGRILSHYQASILGGRHLVTGLQTNALGQRTATVKFNGPTPVVDQLQLDSWGRLAREIQNSSSGSSDAQTNVVTGLRYDLNGNLVDTYEQGSTPGSWVDTHSIFDANNNAIAEVQNCSGGGTTPCGGSAGPDQNVVTAHVYDALNRRTDSYTALPGCTGLSGSCVPAPTCNVGPPTVCVPLGAPCPSATCVDDHITYDLGGRTYQEIANYGGQQDASQANVTTQYTYDADGKLTQTSVPITNSQLQTGVITDTQTYDLLGQLTIDIRGASAPAWMATTQAAEVDYGLDAGGRVVSVTGPGTGSTSSTNRIVTVHNLDDLGRTLYATQDWGNLTGPNGNKNATSRAVYDPRGAQHSWTPPTQQVSGGLETTTNNDLAGNVIATVRDDGPSGLHLTSTTRYDGLGRATDVVDPRGIDSHTAYDALDRAMSTTQNYCPAGSPNTNCSGSGSSSDQNVTSSVVFDTAGNRIETINPRSIVQYTVFDALGRELSVTDNCQPVPTPPSTSCGTQGSDQNVVRSQSYDQASDVLTTVDPLQRKNVLGYDALGRKISETVNCVNMNAQCDAGLGTANDQNLVTQWQVDAQGDVLQVRSPRKWTDGVNLTTAYFYDALLRLISVTEDVGQTGNGHLNLVTSYSYDPSGDRLSQTDGRTYTTTFTIDNLGRTTQVIDAGSGTNAHNTVQTYYNVAGEAIGTYDSRNLSNSNSACTQPPETVCYTLDRLGRLVGVSYLKSNGSTQLSQSFAYDVDGNKIAFADSDVGQTTITYDHLNRVSTVTSPAPVGTSTALVTTYTYNADGAIMSISDPTGASNFTVDHLDRLATMVDPLTSGTTTYVVDAAGRLTRRTEANGIVTTPGYNGVDQLASKTEVLGSNTLASWTNILYDPAQNRTSETLAYPNNPLYPDPQSGTSSYQYDPVDQLLQSSIPSTSLLNYAYDAAHNLTTDGPTQQTYFNNESLNLVGGVAVGSDAIGNELADAFGHAIAWNVLSQLESFAGTSTETYTYDALGRLTSISTNGSLTKQFAYRGVTGQLLEELDGAGNPVRSYAWDSAGRQLYVKAAGSVYYEISDPHGDVAALANASGLAGTEHFDPWGNVLSASHSAISPAYPLLGFPLGFQGTQGSWTDVNNGFVYMAARWYYPKVGRFLSSDPAAGTADPRTPTGRERWLYGANSPLDRSDPTGLLMCMCGQPLPPLPPCTGSCGVTECTDSCTPAPAPPAPPPPKPQQKQQTNCAWYDAVCKAKQAWEATKKVAGDAWNACKNSDVCKTVAPIVVSLVVGAACTAVVGVASGGLGEVGCLALAGAAGGALSGALECKNGESIGGCMATGAAVGAVTGLAGYGVGKLLSVAGRAAVGALGRTALGRAVASGASRALDAMQSGASRALGAVRAGASRALSAVQSGASRAVSAVRSGVSRALGRSPAADHGNFSVGIHGDMPSPRPTGMESHHGVMSAWMKANVRGYDPDKAPAILMPQEAHAMTKATYVAWRGEMTDRMGGEFDWTKVSESEARTLSEQMFDAADVPANIRGQYWDAFDSHLGALKAAAA